MKPNHLPLLFCVLLLGSCSHGALNSLVGADRDEHGCLGSAGYTWSDALHQCVRLWEAAERFDAGQKTAYLLFSPDSACAEVFTNEGTALCYRDKTAPTVWAAKKTNDRVTMANGVTVIKAYGTTYTRSVQ